MRPNLIALLTTAALGAAILFFIFRAVARI
jgi:hypothetical protein